MASNVSQVKAGKLAARDWTAQAAISDVLRNVDLVREAAAGSGATTPLIDSCRELYSSAVADGNGELDMVGVSNVLHRWAERAAA
jgi:3-hydroxyisobutyrate dehydrogenase